jgi:hypothetical protein
VLEIALAALALAAAAPDPTAGLSTRQLAGQRVVTGFSGTTAPKPLLRSIHRGELGGVIVFSSSIRSRSQLRRLTASLQKASTSPARGSARSTTSIASGSPNSCSTAARIFMRA